MARDKAYFSALICDHMWEDATKPSWEIGTRIILLAATALIYSEVMSEVKEKAEQGWLRFVRFQGTFLFIFLCYLPNEQFA